MYESHDMRHIGFPRVNGLSTDPWDLGRHINCIFIYVWSNPSCLTYVEERLTFQKCKTQGRENPRFKS